MIKFLLKILTLSLIVFLVYDYFYVLPLWGVVEHTRAGIAEYWGFEALYRVWPVIVPWVLASLVASLFFMHKTVGLLKEGDYLREIDFLQNKIKALRQENKDDYQEREEYWKKKGDEVNGRIKKLAQLEKKARCEINKAKLVAELCEITNDKLKESGDRIIKSASKRTERAVKSLYNLKKKYGELDKKKRLNEFDRKEMLSEFYGIFEESKEEILLIKKEVH